MDANRIYEIARYVSKNGDLALVSEDTIEWARTLPESDKIDLYCQIRDESQRQESEWRDDFVTRIEIAGSALPEAADETTDIADFLKWAANHKDRGEVMDTLEELLEDASDNEIKLAKQIIVQTSQEDLLPVLEEFAE